MPASEEQAQRPRRSLCGRGSSPRMRGTFGRRNHREQRYRFIPAHAGNMMRGGRSMSMRPVHPRACGEHDNWQSVKNYIHGSSPRMRGTSCTFASHFAPGRFIPAHAGNIGSKRFSTTATTVHPRACGEHICIGRKLTLVCGSSPRMRGTYGFNTALHVAVRFIPAHAGNILLPFLRQEKRAVHPRACGEHRSSASWARLTPGSSPRMRGT